MSSSPNPSTARVAPAVHAGNHVQLAPGVVAKIRNPILVVVFTIITLGIYQLFWWYFINREIADYGRARGTKELGTTPRCPRSRSSRVADRRAGHLDVGHDVQAHPGRTTSDRPAPLNGWLGLVIGIVISPVLVGYMQSGLNSAWQAATSPEPASA